LSVTSTFVFQDALTSESLFPEAPCQEAEFQEALSFAPPLPHKALARAPLTA